MNDPNLTAFDGGTDGLSPEAVDLLVTDYLDGTLPEAERTALEQWMSRDPSVREAVDGQRRAIGALRSLPPVAAPPDLERRLQKRLTRSAGRSGDRAPFGRLVGGRSPLLSSLAAVATVLVAVVAAHLMFAHLDAQRGPSDDAAPIRVRLEQPEPAADRMSSPTAPAAAPTEPVPQVDATAPQAESGVVLRKAAPSAGARRAAPAAAARSATRDARSVPAPASPDAAEPTLDDDEAPEVAIQPSTVRPPLSAPTVAGRSVETDSVTSAEPVFSTADSVGASAPQIQTASPTNARAKPR